MPGWLCDLLINFGGVFLGAILGGYLGYKATVRAHREDDEARRAVLFRSLRHQLSRMRAEPVRFVRGLSNHKDPTEISAVGHLLSGHVLDARTDGALIEALLELDGRIRALNEIVRVNNQSFFLTGLYVDNERVTKEREHWHEVFGMGYRELIKLRDRILPMLPPDLDATSRLDAPAPAMLGEP